MALESGTRVGIYEVTAKIGEGGMGEVYQARDTTLDRDVALKVLPEAFTADPERLVRFQREAKVLASLNHPNIGGIYGLERSDEAQALVLELIEGPTLADRIEEGVLPRDETLAIAGQIAEALEAAHEQGIVHRDLKPANVKVKADGTVKVLDFGLAKAVSSDASGASATTSATMSLTASATQMGMVIGTAAYMAPEQAKGKPVDKRADIWAFGVILLEMLSGQRLFTGETASETLAAVMMQEPAWDRLPADLPTKLDNLLRRCLQKDPKERVRDIGDARLAMQGAFETTIRVAAESTAGAAPHFWQRPVVAGAILGVTTLTVAAAMWVATRPAPPAPGLVARFEVPLRTEETFTAGPRHMVAVSPDGQQIVYSTAAGLSLRSLGDVTPVQVSGTDGSAREPFFSPDGQWIGFHSNGQLRKVATSGGAPVTLCDAQFLYGASWGVDDQVVYGQGPEGIWRVAGTSGTPELLVPLENGEQAHGPQMLPGGEWMLFTLRPADVSSWDAAHIVAQSMETGERIVLVQGGRDARYVETGHLVYGLNGVLFAVAFDAETREVFGGPVPLVEGVRAAGNAGRASGAVQYSVAHDGSLVYIPGGAGLASGMGLAWVSLDGDSTPMSAPTHDYQDVRVSPDGTRVAAALNLENNTDIWIWYADDGPLTRLTFDEAEDTVPLWSPDGEQVVFWSTRDGGGVFSKAADGTGEVRRLFGGDAQQQPWGWSDEGDLVVTQTPGDIGVVSLGNDASIELILDTGFISDTPAVSPSGRWIVYQSNESGEAQIYVQPFPNVNDGKWQISTNRGFDPVWSPDERAIYFWEPTNPGRMMRAEVQTEPTFSPNNATEFLGQFGAQFNLFAVPRGYDIHPDGTRFLARTRDGTDQGAGGAGLFTGLIVVENWFEELKDRVPLP